MNTDRSRIARGSLPLIAGSIAAPGIAPAQSVFDAGFALEETIVTARRVEDRF